MFGGEKEIKDLPHDIVNQLETFFINYNTPEGKNSRH